MAVQSASALPARADADWTAIRVHHPWNLRIEFYSVAIMVFALAQGFFVLLDRRDVGDGNGNPENFAGFVAHRLIRHHPGRSWRSRLCWRSSDLNARKSLAAQCSLEVWLYLCIERGGHNLRDLAPQNSPDR